MRLTLGTLLLAAATLLPSLRASAAEIVLEQSAVDKLVARALFDTGGRFVLLGGSACGAYLERPAVELKDGRIRIRARLQARLGVESAGQCLGVDIGSWAVVSGRPVANGGKVRLDELRIDSVDDPTLQLVLESGLLPSLPRAVDLDVLAAVRSMLQNTGANLQTSVDAFQIDSVQVGGARLAVRFDFKLLAR